MATRKKERSRIQFCNRITDSPVFISTQKNTDLKMLMIEWSDELSIGIESVDEQHQKMVNMINALKNAATQAKDDAIIIQIFDGLATYIEKHFAYEEALFEKYDFSDHAAHIQEHAVLSAQVENLKERFEAGEDVLTDALMSFLNEWLHEHILVSDMHYAKELIPKGAQ
ncbi:MAG: hemerythrin family protein [Gammaproteobacteria bacterium]|nr:hemerythrin family protein [Gammaproteobacteria bacterium]MBT7023848.1 hemerythrin family protein [Gammaproteobacteria bacterium]MBT7830763.1 hemerythrin family protein [Candidatus Neomarinimicrobiota bacterium]